MSDLQANKHANAKLQNHYNKYGPADLTLVPLLECDMLLLLLFEQYYIDKLNPFFNICKIANSRIGVRANLETRKRLRVNSRFRRRTAWNYRPG